MSMSRFAPAAVLSTLAILLVACGGAPAASAPAGGGAPATQPGSAAPPAGGGGGGGGGGGTTVAACDLLTEQDFEEVIGQAVEDMTEGPVLGIYQNGCEWTLAATDTLAQGDVTLGVVAPGGRSYYETYFEPFIGEISGPEESVQGVGDKAARFDTGGMMVVKGDVLISVEHFAVGNDDETARRLVDRILPRLP
jgi:hypothetical protein